MMAWAQAGVSLLHYTGDQIGEGTAVTSYAAIAPGDLVLVPGSDGTVANPDTWGSTSATDSWSRRSTCSTASLSSRTRTSSVAGSQGFAMWANRTRTLANYAQQKVNQIKEKQ